MTERLEMMPITAELFDYACAVDRISQHLFSATVNSRKSGFIDYQKKFNMAKQSIDNAYEEYGRLKHQLKQMGREGILSIYTPLLEVLEDRIKEAESRFTKFWGKSAA